MLCVLVLLLPLVMSSDVAVGLNSYGTKIFDENRQASPAIWRQTENVTIVASDNEVISKVLVIDMRPDKDGDAKIVDGGEKQKNVTIELKSPTVFRGYDFHIEVYAIPEAHSSNTDQQAINSTDNTSMSINDKTTSTQSSSIIEVSSEQSTIEPVSTGTIKDSRNLNTKINNELNGTGIRNIMVDSENKINTNTEDSTSLDGHSTSSDITSTVSSPTTNNNIPDFPLTGMEGDEKRHIRKIGDDLYTTLDNIPSTIIQTESTTESYSFDNKSGIALEEGLNGNSTTLDLGVKGETDSTTVSDVTTTLSDESVTMSPDKNGKDIPDFDDLLSTDGEETRFARQINAKIVSTTNSEISTTEDGLTTTLPPENFNNLDNEYNTTSDMSEAANGPQINMAGENTLPNPKIIIKNGAYGMNIMTNTRKVDENDLTESSGDNNLIDNIGDITTSFPDTPLTTISSSENSAEEQFRNVRGISEENYTINQDTTEQNLANIPAFVDPSMDKSNVDNDYVYVPILAVISKHNYPLFRGVLDNISMNVAFPGLNETPQETQGTNEIPDTESRPIISLT